LREDVAVRRRHTEHLADYRGGNRQREIGHDIHSPVCSNGIESRVDDALNQLVDGVDRARREGAADELAKARVRGRILQQHELLPGVVGRQVGYAVAAAVASAYTRWDFAKKPDDVAVATQPPEPQRGFVNRLRLSKSARTLVHGVALIEVERVPACPAVVFHGGERLGMFIHRVLEWDYPPVGEFVKTAHMPPEIEAKADIARTVRNRGVADSRTRSDLIAPVDPSSVINVNTGYG